MIETFAACLSMTQMPFGGWSTGRRKNKVTTHSPRKEFLDPSRKKICLLDEEHAELLFTSRYDGDFINSVSNSTCYSAVCNLEL